MSVRSIKPLRARLTVAVLHDPVALHCYDCDLKELSGGRELQPHPFLLLPDLSLRKPLTATIKREHPPAVISLCRTDHNKVPISNHHVDIILNHNLCFSDDASTGRKSIHKQHYWAISHDVNRWHISQNNFVFSDAGGGEGSRVRGQRDCH